MSDQKKIALVIDDDKTQQILMKEYLTAAGYVVRVAENGERGLSMAANFNPEVILLDLVLPTIDGFEICEQLKNDPETSNIPVILITGARDNDVISRGIGVGVDDFVTKPVDWQFLPDRINHVLRQKEENANAAAASQPMPETMQSAADQAAQQEQISSLQHELEVANARIADLSTREEDLRAQLQSEPTDPDNDIYAQLDGLEQEWTQRLQESMSQAKQRSDERVQALNTRWKEHSEKDREKIEQLEAEVWRLQQKVSDTRKELEQEFEQQAEERLEDALQQIEEGQELVQVRHAEEITRLCGYFQSQGQQLSARVRQVQRRVARSLTNAMSGPEPVADTRLLSNAVFDLSELEKQCRSAMEFAEQTAGEAEPQRQNAQLSGLVKDVVEAGLPGSFWQHAEVTQAIPKNIAILTDREKFSNLLEIMCTEIIGQVPNGSGIHFEGISDVDGMISLRIFAQCMTRERDEYSLIQQYVQTDGQPLPAESALWSTAIPGLKSLLNTLGIKMTIELSGAEGDAMGGCITLAPITAGSQEDALDEAFGRIQDPIQPDIGETAYAPAVVN